MATIRRGTIVQETIDALKLQVGGDTPNQTSDKFVLTYDYSNIRTADVAVGIGSVSTGAVTIYTTPVNLF